MIQTVDARERAGLNQVVCTLEGMCTLLQATPGPLAVVIHGDLDCVNVLVCGADSPGCHRFYCTRLSEEHAVAAGSRARLDACLELVCREAGVRRVFLLGTCLSTLLGDDLEQAAHKATERTGVPVAALAGAGMRFVSQAKVVDRFACLMLPAATTADEPTEGVNLVGFDPSPGVRAGLEELGVRVNAVLDLGASLAAWDTFGGAGVDLVLDTWLCDGLLEQAASRFGHRHAEVPYPVGYRATRAFFEKALQAAGPDVAGRGIEAGTQTAVLEELAAPARRAVEQARDRCAGTRLGYNIGSMKNLRPRTLAREGLCDLPVFEELGFEPVILVQGDDRPERLEAVRAVLDGFGCRAPFAVFSDTVYFGALCREHGCRMVYGSDHLRDQVRASGAALVEHGTLQPGFEAAAGNVERILAALEETA